jgi:hypothetical protein
MLPEQGCSDIDQAQFGALSEGFPGEVFIQLGSQDTFGQGLTLGLAGIGVHGVTPSSSGLPKPIAQHVPTSFII